VGPGPFTPDPLGSTWPAPFPWLSFGFSGPVPGHSVVTVAESGELVTTQTAKQNAKVDYADEDYLFNIWRCAARRLVEREAETALVTQTLRMNLPGWPGDGQVRLPVGPAKSVTSVKYYDAGGTQQTLSEGTDFQTWLDYRPPLVLPYPQKYWPVVQFGRVPAVEVVYVAAPTVQNASLGTQAVLMTIGYWAVNRGDEEAPEKFGLPQGAVRLIRLLKSSGYR